MWGSKNTGQTLATNRGRGRPEEFASDTAKATGQSKSGINQKIARADNVVVLSEVKGTAAPISRALRNYPCRVWRDPINLSLPVEPYTFELCKKLRRLRQTVNE